MKTLVVTAEDEIVEKLEKVAPEHSPRRSELFSQALRRILWDLEERETCNASAAAYQMHGACVRGCSCEGRPAVNQK